VKRIVGYDVKEHIPHEKIEYACRSTAQFHSESHPAAKIDWAISGF
jgi:hypothetical protein